jgi:methyl-accepting chemotaxis protein
MRTPQTISARVTVALVGIAAIALLSTGTMLYSVQASGQARQDLARFGEVASQFQSIQQQFDLQRGLQAEYVVTGDDAKLVSFEESAVVAFATVDEIVEGFSDIAGVEELANRIAELDTIHDEAFFAELPPAVAAGDSAAAQAALDNSVENLANLTAATQEFQGLIDAERALVEERLDGILSTARTAAFLLVALALAGIAAGVASTRRATAPISEVVVAAGKLAQGDTSITLPSSSVAEVAEMIDAFRGVVSYLGEASELAQSIAVGDLSGDFTPKGPNDRLGTALNSMTHSLIDLVAGVQNLAGTVTQSSSSVAQSSGESTQVALEVAQSITVVASGATDQARILERLAESVNAIVAEIEMTADSARRVVAASDTAKGEVDNGLALVTDVAETMDSITHAFGDVAGSVERLERQFVQVEDIVDLIRAIAEQTNLLALNAAIEAARAGELGRGFAVVASEVKALAEQSASSTGKIAEIVGSMKHGVGEAVSYSTSGRDQVLRGAEVVSSTGEAFRTIAGSIDEIDARSRAVEEATGRIEFRSQEIAAGAHELTGLTESNSAAAEQVAAASEEASATASEMGDRAHELASAAVELDGMLARFRV